MRERNAVRIQFRQMRILPLVLAAVLATACSRGPSRDEALAAFRGAKPGVDSGPAVVRVWADGPPWFSCAELIAKLKTSTDRVVVRNQLSYWHALVLADWVTLRDTTSGAVVEPGWCAASLRAETTRLSNGWKPVEGDSVASGGVRRGWDVLVGAQRVAVPAKTTLVGRDSARATYVVTVIPNENGMAAGADRDTTRHDALLEKVDGRWRLIRMDTMQ